MAYGFTETSIIRQGYLYNWYVTQLDVAPSGYRVASFDDWQKIAGNTAQNLRTSGSEWSSYMSYPGYDVYNFSAIPVPKLDLNSPYNWLYPNDYAFFWTSTGSGENGYSFTVYNNNVDLFYQNWKPNVLAIRCCRNASATEIATKFNGEVVEQVTDYDGNVYDAVKINTLIWLRQNLATSRDNSGTYISHKTSGATVQQTYPVYVQPNFSSSNVFFANEEASWWKHVDNNPPIPSLGLHFGGGIIGYIFKPADPGYVAGEVHGLIVSFSELGYATQIGYAWGYPGVNVEGAWGSALGTGAQNTFDLFNGVALGTVWEYDQPVYIHNWEENGYDDWFLPSKDEMFWIMYSQAVNFGTKGFMTSTQIDANTYYSINRFFSAVATNKNNFYALSKPVRYF